MRIVFPNNSHCVSSMFKITFPNPNKPNFVQVTTTKSNKTYMIQNVYSMIPTCDCPWAKQGNMCKHQCKALMVKGHAGGLIIKQFGSKAGSKFEGMECIEEQGCLLYDEGSESLVGFDGLEVPNSELGLIEAPPDASQLDSISHRDKCVDKSRQAFLEMEKMAFQSDSIAQSMQAKLSQTLHALKIQEHSQLVCGKEVLTTADMFVRPNGLTLKRRLAVVDKYHGAAKRTKRLLNSYLKRKRQQDQERDGGVGICACCLCTLVLCFC
jgi:hypothetical protein